MNSRGYASPGSQTVTHRRVMSRPRSRLTTSADNAVGDRPSCWKLSCTVDERIAHVRRPRPIGHCTASWLPSRNDRMRMSLAPVRSVMAPRGWTLGLRQFLTEWVNTLTTSAVGSADGLVAYQVTA